MPKIVVKDMDGEIQVFKGPGLKFFENARGVDIYDMDRTNDGPGMGKIAHIKNYQWVKTEDDKTPPPSGGRTVQRADEIDRYTRAELDQRDPNDSPDFHMLRERPLEEVTAPPRPRPLPEFNGPIKFPEDTEFTEHGGAIVPGAAPLPPIEPLPGTVTEDGDPVDPPMSLDDLKAKGLIKTGADLDAIEGETPAERLRVRWERDGVDSMDMPAMRQWLDKLPEDERAAMEEKAAAEKRRRDAERKRASRAKKKAQADKPQYGTSPVAAIVKPLQEANEKLKAELENINPPQIEDPLEPEPPAPRRGNEDCETCGGRGTVPDPESDDPLDTMLCPDC